ncbi:RNA polymerase sigma factor [Mucilaginibacter myungsuensis]|uniref:Sigma-70 family RNA polymerase sigma factor n=1 Tax=Mucilaginibacter myungsuensis TaxID=649104 RepID=A0A929L007_9SPHI|nr:sigma-70 family RNA polymerase sigma factor [Mucilaginibacter myungsuensis]MBE9661665.1 sigma-70 family RNA polymerase sigma factor [Mucilaginibacter myungsuensis]MDN3597809.1 sigma-70 family RNA polymerase sigma factor [Mucilaginibacter myungsuensis]
MITDLQQKNIWVGVIAHDRKQEELFYKTFASRMLSVCLRYAKDRDEAQDILQEGFIKAFKNRHNYRGEGSLEGWLRRIMVHASISRYRKQRPIVLCEDMGAEEMFSDAYCNDELEAKDLMRMIRQLPDSYRNVFNMYAIEGYSHQEIGSVLGMTELLSRTTLCRARTILRNKIAKISKCTAYEMAG